MSISVARESWVDTPLGTVRHIRTEEKNASQSKDLNSLCKD